MATIEIINFCNDTLKKQGWKKIGTNDPSTVDTKLFGVDFIVSHRETEMMSEAEKLRHEKQDIDLLCFYIHPKPESVRSIRSSIITRSQNPILLAEFQAKFL